MLAVEVKRMIRELDWKTPLEFMNVGQHWRIWLSILVFSALSTATWHNVFPHTMGFTKLWTGFATGSFIGILAGVYWQFQDTTLRGQTSGKFLLTALLGWGAFAVISLVSLAPQMRAEETLRSQTRSLRAQAVLSIELKDRTVRKVITDRKSIEHFCKATSHAELFYPSHEGSIQEYEIVISLQGGEIRSFRARIPERHQNDLSLDFRGPSHWTEILLPDGRLWIQSAIAQKEDSKQQPAQLQSEGAPSDWVSAERSHNNE